MSNPYRIGRLLDDVVGELRVGLVEGDLLLEDGAIVVPEAEAVIVKGRVVCRGDCTFNGDLVARMVRVKDGNIEVKGNLTVAESLRVRRGGLYVDGDVEAKFVEVDERLEISGSFSVLEASVGGSLRAGKGDAERIAVGGVLEMEELKADKVSVGGSLSCKRLEADRVSVGGTAHLGEGRFSTGISVGGTLEVEGLVESGKVSVGGIVMVGACKAEKVSVGGRLSSRGDLRVEVVSVGGALEVGGVLEAAKVSVGGVMEVGGDARVADKLSVGGTLIIRGVLQAGVVSAGAEIRAHKIVAETLSATNLFTEKGAWARRIKIGRGGRVRGPIIAEEVYLDRGVSAEVVYAKLLEAEEKCRLRSVHAEEIFLGEYCKVSGEVEYVERLELGRGVELAQKPVRIDRVEFPRDNS